MARELNLVSQRLQKWVGKYKESQEDILVENGNRSRKDQVGDEKDKQTRDLEEEVAILKKAMDILAKSKDSLWIYSRTLHEFRVEKMYQVFRCLQELIL